MTVIFDLDGVLIRSERLWRSAYPKAYAEVFNRPFPSVDMGTLQGLRYHEVASEILHRSEINLSSEDRLLCETYAASVIDVLLRDLESSAESIHGSLQVLNNLLDRDIKLALASSSPRRVVDAELAFLGIKDAFQAVVTGDDVTNSKPNPEIFLRTASLLGVRPGECTVVEDSPAGVIAALEADMQCVLLISSESPPLPWQHVLRCRAVVSDLRSLNVEMTFE
jgi:HAD superfamily hydrolase (TIGR01509 family)